LVATDPNAERKTRFLFRLEQVFIFGYYAIAKSRRFFPYLQIIEKFFFGVGGPFRNSFFSKPLVNNAE